MTRNKKKAYRQMAKGRIKEVGGIMKFIRGLFIVKKADTRFSFERWKRERKIRKAKSLSLSTRLGILARQSWSRAKTAVKNTVSSAYAFIRGALSSFR